MTHFVKFYLAIRIILSIRFLYFVFETGNIYIHIYILPVPTVVIIPVLE